MQKEIDCPTKDNSIEVGQDSQEDVLMDFSSMFKGKKMAKRPVLQSKKIDQPKTVNWLLQIPAKLDITREQLQQRKVFNSKKWKCIIKMNPKTYTQINQKLKMKLIMSVISSWNYLYSNKGLGTQEFITTKKSVQLLNKQINQILSNTVYDQFKRLQFIQNICEILSNLTSKRIQASIKVKLEEPDKLQIESKEQINNLLIDLNQQKNGKSFIYLTYNDVLCPIGYQITPMKPLDAYQKLQNIEQSERQLWIICSTTGNFEPAFQIKRWTTISQDLSALYPEYLDIKEHKKGLQKRENPKPQLSGNPNYIVQISKVQ